MLAQVLGFGMLFVGIFLTAVLGAWTLRFTRTSGSLVDALVQSAFLPEKRRRYMLILSVEGSLMIDTGIVWSLTLIGWIPPSAGNVLVAAFFLAGMGSVLALTWVGLRPSILTEASRDRIRREAPAVLGSLFVAPYGLAEEGNPGDSPR
jgi:hypothetical protein